MSLKRRLEKLELSKPKPSPASPVPPELERAIARLTPSERRADIAALKDIIAREPTASQEAKDAAILLLKLYEELERAGLT